MALFKITFEVKVLQTYVAYVEAESETDAENWADGVQDEATVGTLFSEDCVSSVDEIVPVDVVPSQYKTIMA